jgi:predicted RNA-binding Zn ribbon-like protein
MSAKYLVPALLVTLLAGCASTGVASTTDPVRARVLAELEQARKDGSYPPSEANYVYPNWVKTANPAGVVMTDGHPEYDNAKPASTAARSTAVATPAAAIMTDASSGNVAAGSVKGGNAAH